MIKTINQNKANIDTVKKGLAQQNMAETRLWREQLRFEDLKKKQIERDEAFEKINAQKTDKIQREFRIKAKKDAIRDQVRQTRKTE